MLMGLMATIVVPNLGRLRPGYQRQQFVTQMTALMRLSWQQALIKQKPHRLLFDLKKKLVKVEQEVDDGDAQKFESILVPYLRAEYTWDDTLSIKQFFIEKTDMLNRPGIKTEQIWFYVAPDGLVQPVIINMLDANDSDERGQPTQFSLVSNPFSAEFKEYEKFRKP